MPITLTPSAIALLGLVGWSLLLVFLLDNMRGINVITGRKAVNSFTPTAAMSRGSASV